LANSDTLPLARQPKYDAQCPAQEIIGPKSHPELTEKNVEKLFKSDEFKNLTVARLSGAVKIPTEDFDDIGPVGEDARWDVFYELEKYFRDTSHYCTFLSSTLRQDK